LYPLKKAVLHFDEGRYAEGEMILSRLYCTAADETGKSAARAIQLLKAQSKKDGAFDWQDDIPLFKAAALAGMPHAAACCAVFLGAAGDKPEAVAMIGRARAARPRNPLFRRLAGTVRKAGQSSTAVVRPWHGRGIRAKALLRPAIARCRRLLHIAGR
jgi:hypothetical protein